MAEIEEAERAHAELLARLPPGWAEFFTDDAVPYYYNLTTQEAVWEPPQVEVHYSRPVMQTYIIV